MIYIILGILIAAAGIFIPILLRRRSKNKKREELLTEAIEQSPELSVMKDFDKSATDIVTTFWWYIKSDESPYNRAQRRMILRHFKKFLFAWPDLNDRHKDIGKIVHYLSQGPHNHDVVKVYRETVSGLPIKSDTDGGE